MFVLYALHQGSLMMKFDGTAFRNAVDARHEWIDTIALNGNSPTAHPLIRSRWEVFTSFVHSIPMEMGEFEEYLKRVDPIEYEYAQGIKR
jgi:hypothetical protein